MFGDKNYKMMETIKNICFQNVLSIEQIVWKAVTLLTLLKCHLYLNGCFSVLTFFLISSRGRQLAVTCPQRKFWKHLTLCTWKLYLFKLNKLLNYSATKSLFPGHPMPSQCCQELECCVTHNGEGTVNNSLVVQPEGSVKANITLRLVRCWKAI